MIFRRNLLFLVVIVATVSLAGALPAISHAVLEKGEPIQIRLSQPLDSETDQSGESFRALLDQPLVPDGQLLAPVGSTVLGELLEVRPSGKVKGKALLRLTLRSLTVDGKTYFLTTNELEIRAEGSTRKDATLIGGGAGVGAIVGAMIGGKKGAAIGAAVGAGAGTAAVLVTDGKEIRFEEEQLFQFVLEEDLRLPVLGHDAPSDPAPEDHEPDTAEHGGGSNQESDATEAELTALVDDLQQDSAWLLRQARRKVEDRQQDLSLESYFVLHAFDSSVQLFSELWQQKDPDHLSGVLKQLVSHFDQADSVLAKSGLPWDARREWEWMGDRVRELDQSYDAFVQGAIEPSLQGRLLWKGRVEGSASIILTGSEVSLHVLEGDPVREASHTLSSGLPRKALDIRLVKQQGRGTISLLERPSRWNDYRVVILIEDDQRGADDYLLELSWQ